MSAPTWPLSASDLDSELLGAQSTMKRVHRQFGTDPPLGECDVTHVSDPAAVGST